MYKNNNPPQLRVLVHIINQAKLSYFLSLDNRISIIGLEINMKSRIIRNIKNSCNKSFNQKLFYPVSNSKAKLAVIEGVCVCFLL